MFWTDPIFGFLILTYRFTSQYIPISSYYIFITMYHYYLT